MRVDAATAAPAVRHYVAEPPPRPREPIDLAGEA